jgi:hypothetical protein
VRRSQNRTFRTATARERHHAAIFWAALLRGSRGPARPSPAASAPRAPTKDEEADGSLPEPFFGDAAGETWRVIARPGSPAASVDQRAGDLMVRRSGGAGREWLCVPVPDADGRTMFGSDDRLRAGTLILRRSRARERPAAAAAPALGMDAEDLPARYGGYMLQRGDDDARQIWGGRRRGAGDTQPAAGQTGFVMKLQEELRELGFLVVGTPDGRFRWPTEWAMREFQHEADSRWLAQEQAPSANPPPRYVDRLAQVQTPSSQLTPSIVCGWLSANDAARIDLWLANRWRCPVVIEAWRSADLDASGQPRAGRQPREQNIWRHTEPAQQAWRVLARDFSRRYDVTALGRGADDMRVLGYRETAQKGGPQSVPPHHVWPEAEITPLSMTGRAIGSLTAEELSTFKVVRAFSETECEGYLDSLNCWDNVILSAGPGHWPIGEAHWSAAQPGWPEGGELGGFLAYLRRHYPEAYFRLTDLAIQPAKMWDPSDARFFSRSQRRYHSRLQWRRPAHDSAFETVPLDPEDMSYFKSWRWVYRFQMAARTDAQYRRAMWDYARIRVRDVLATPWGAGLQVGTGSAARPATIGDVFRSERNVAMVVRWHIRFPAHVVSGGHAGAKMRDVLAAAGIAADPTTWGDVEETRLTNAIMAAPSVPDTMDTVRNWPTWTAAANRNRFALDLSPLPAAERTLRADRGSFRLSAP